MDQKDPFNEHLAHVESILGYTFQNKRLLSLAFVHRSYFNENKEIFDGHNERLEFLGDAVLGLVMSDFLYQKLPDEPEGELSHLRSHLVGAASCAQYIQTLKLEPFLLLGKGEKGNVGKGRERILANLFEAIVAAIYLDGGEESARGFLMLACKEHLDQVLRSPITNWKAQLQDYAQKKTQKPPEYRVIQETGPPHSKQFVVAVFVEDKELGRGEGSSKKQAEADAAERAWKEIETDGQD